MKKNRNILLVLLLLIAVTAYFLINKKSGTLERELSDFAYRDTGAVSRIFLADRTGKQVAINRKGPGDWVLDDGSEARNDAVNALLDVIRNIGIRSPVAKAAYNNVVKAIATKGIKIEIYKGADKVKTYYVGGPTQDQMGTFMYLDGSSVPFVTQIPGFNGYLTPRFITNSSDWKTHRLFRYTPGAIQTLAAVDKEVKGYYIKLEADGKGDYILYDSNGKKVEPVSQDKITSYLQFYESINYEMEETSISPDQRDSLLKTIPYREISITGMDGLNKRIELWRRPITPSTTHKTNASGDPFAYDIDRMTARFNNDTALVVVQFFVFDKLFRKPADFVVAR